MRSTSPIQVRVARPIVTAIVEEQQQQSVQYNIVEVYVEKQETEPPTWRLILIDANEQRYLYDLFFS